MTPALSSGRTPDEGGAETCGIEGRTEENREARRVDEGVRVAVGAGDIPSATDMGLTLGKSSEQDTLGDEPRDQAGNLGRAHGAVCGPVRHSDSLPFSPTPAPPQDAHRESQGGDCSGLTGTEEAGGAGAGASMSLLAATVEVIGSSGEAVWAETLGTSPVPDMALNSERLGCTAELEAASTSTPVPGGAGQYAVG